MISKKYTMPEYPCKADVWDMLAKEARPIVVYGMGNGADKLFRRFESYGIKVAEVFASDGFVRGHSFRGYKVKSFSDIKAEYSDFVIVLSFASNRREVIEMLAEIDSLYDMYIPDMPVSDEIEYFDREFYNRYYEEICGVYEMLADDTSKNIFAACLNYRLTGKMEYLLGGYSERDEMYSRLPCDRIKTVIDAGAYNGDTAREAMFYFPNLEKIYAIEPDVRNYKKLTKFADDSETTVIPINAAVWNECRDGIFMGSGNRNSSVSSTASHRHSEAVSSLITVDSLGVTDADYIKYDVEGAEYEALLGSLNTISKSRPVLLVSLYHRSRDSFFLPDFLRQKLSGYRFYVRRLYSVPAWELNLIAVPIE
ncbi:MAG: FkbM family methyltransferase [Ruminococcaceae bacterium]|nr:FkbM family methyltransferase [Oscillospiraceae bacterium]